jgi:hypothetical protein
LAAIGSDAIRVFIAISSHEKLGFLTFAIAPDAPISSARRTSGDVTVDVDVDVKASLIKQSATGVDMSLTLDRRKEEWKGKSAQTMEI